MLALWQAALDWQRRAFERHEIELLDDHRLRDIGLTRADIDWLKYGRTGAGRD